MTFPLGFRMQICSFLTCLSICTQFAVCKVILSISQVIGILSGLKKYRIVNNNKNVHLYWWTKSIGKNYTNQRLTKSVPNSALASVPV